MDTNKILDKIQKLFALAEDKNNVAEAASASARAQELMTKYKITQMAVDSYNGKEIYEEPIIDFMKQGQSLDKMGAYVSTWKSRLADLISKNNNCRVYLQSVKSTTGTTKYLALIGRENDANTVKYMYEYLILEIERLCNLKLNGNGKEWANNFKIGAVEEIGCRMQEAKKQALIDIEKELNKEYENQGVSLVHVNNALEKFRKQEKQIEDFFNSLKLKKSPPSRSNYNRDAFEQGREAAKQIDLSTRKDSLTPGVTNKLKGV